MQYLTTCNTKLHAILNYIQY